MFKVEKDGVVKTIKSEVELGMYISAGWKKVNSKPIKKEIKEYPKNRVE